MRERKKFYKRLGNGVIIENATPSDALKIVDLINAGNSQLHVNIRPDLTGGVVRPYAEGEAIRNRKHKAIIRSIKSRRSLVLVARDGDDIVGFARAEFKGWWRRKHLNTGNYVTPTRQGEGIGTALTRLRLIWHGSVDIFLYTVPGTPGEGFHKSCGFKPTGVETTSSYRKLPLIEMKLSPQDQTVVFSKGK